MGRGGRGGKEEGERRKGRGGRNEREGRGRERGQTSESTVSVQGRTSCRLQQL